MRSRRPALVEVLAMSLAASMTTWLATLAWRGFTRDPASYLAPLLLLALLVALVGAGLRRLHAPGALVLLAQLVLGLVAVTTLVTGSLLPVGNGLTELLQALATAVTGAQQYRAPVPAQAAIDPLLVLGGWFCMVLVDLFACTLRRVPLAGLPLLAIYSIPVSVLGGGVAWWAFALTAAGFLADALPPARRVRGPLGSQPRGPARRARRPVLDRPRRGRPRSASRPRRWRSSPRCWCRPCRSGCSGSGPATVPATTSPSRTR